MVVQRNHMFALLHVWHPQFLLKESHSIPKKAQKAQDLFPPWKHATSHHRENIYHVGWFVFGYMNECVHLVQIQRITPEILEIYLKMLMWWRGVGGGRGNAAAPPPKVRWLGLLYSKSWYVSSVSIHYKFQNFSWILFF